MTNVGKTLTAIGAAAAVGGGVLLYNVVDTDTTVNNETEIVTIETVDVPLVEIELATVELADVSIVKEITTTELEELNLPEVELAAVTTENIIIIQPGKDNIEYVKEYTEFYNSSKKLFKDMRNLTKDATMYPGKDNYKAWLATYQANDNYKMNYVKLPANIKMIAQVELPKDDNEYKTLTENLRFYKKEGYNATLVVFDGTESIYELNELVTYIKDLGFNVWFAFSGAEDLRVSVFPEQTKFAEYLNTLGKSCDGFILGWRRTSLHLFIQDKPWYNFVISNVRKYNNSIPVIGEAYIGETAVTPERTRTVCYNIPENASGVMVNGLGFNGVAVETALVGVFKECSNYDRLALIVGDKPYYNTLHNTGKTIEQNYNIKKQLEQRFLKAGCTGTITLHGDGSNGVHGANAYDNLCKPSQN